jgi:hypothetical protein
LMACNSASKVSAVITSANAFCYWSSRNTR